jgi:hypothetical protein
VRDAETLARPWAIPGAPGLEHRIGGLSKQENTGNVSYDPANHARMIALREEKVARIAPSLPPVESDGRRSRRSARGGLGRHARRDPLGRRSRRAPTGSRCRRSTCAT